jgi:hypothetical protein
MKKLGIVRLAGGLAIFALLFSSCAKDSLTKPELVSKKSKTTITPNDPDPNGQVGAIQATVTGETWPVSMLVYNDTYNSGEVPANEQGILFLKNIPVGKYIVVIHAMPPDDISNIKSVVFDAVPVIADEITDLGDVSFGN